MHKGFKLLHETMCTGDYTKFMTPSGTVLSTLKVWDDVKADIDNGITKDC